jgi:hypothetical protein
MSGFITASGENYLLSLVTTPGTVRPTYFFALGMTKPPTRHMSGAEMDEPNVISYARASFVNASGNWTERVSAISNTIAVVFPVATSPWGVIRFWGLCDAAVGGQLLWAGTLATPITVNTADQVVLAPGQVTLMATGYTTGVQL